MRAIREEESCTEEKLVEEKNEGAILRMEVDTRTALDTYRRDVQIPT